MKISTVDVGSPVPNILTDTTFVIKEKKCGRKTNPYPQFKWLSVAYFARWKMAKLIGKTNHRVEYWFADAWLVHLLSVCRIVLGILIVGQPIIKFVRTILK